MSTEQTPEEQQRVVWSRLRSHRANLVKRLSKEKERYLAARRELNPKTTQAESSHDPLYRDTNSLTQYTGKGIDVSSGRATHLLYGEALLPPLHFGGRPARTTNNALHYVTHKIKDLWRKKQVTSVLFLDIEGAFPNVVNEKLIANMKRRKVPTKIVRFVENMLQGRMTKLKFDDHELGKITIDNGIGQGDPLSMALYQYYNADLLDVPQVSNEDAVAYVDNAILIATAKSFEETHKILEEMMTRNGGAMDWANEHNSNFKLTKLALMDFVHRNKKLPRLPLQIESTTVMPSSSAKYLGVYLDQHLNWKEQEANALRKGTNWVA